MQIYRFQSETFYIREDEGKARWLLLVLQGQNSKHIITPWYIVDWYIRTSAWVASTCGTKLYDYLSHGTSSLPTTYAQTEAACPNLISDRNKRLSRVMWLEVSCRKSISLTAFSYSQRPQHLAVNQKSRDLSNSLYFTANKNRIEYLLFRPVIEWILN